MKELCCMCVVGSRLAIEICKHVIFKQVTNGRRLRFAALQLPSRYHVFETTAQSDEVPHALPYRYARAEFRYLHEDNMNPRSMLCAAQDARWYYVMFICGEYPASVRPS